MKEQIKNHLMMVDKYAPTLDSDIERHADEIMELVNAEVERRIAERMPTDEDAKKEAEELFEGTETSFKKGMYSGFLFCFKWFHEKMKGGVK